MWFDCRCHAVNESVPDRCTDDRPKFPEWPWLDKMKGEGYANIDHKPTRIYSSEWDEGSKEKLMESWYSALEDYTSRALTYSSDRLIAVSGVARAMEIFIKYHELLSPRRGSRPKYLAGLWGMHFESQLGWSVRDAVPEAQLSLAPSWSWASVPHGIKRNPPHWTNITLVDWHVTLDNAQDEFGAVKDGFIKLRCQPLVPISIRQDKYSCSVQIDGEEEGKYFKSRAWIDHPAKTPGSLTGLFAMPAFKYVDGCGGLILEKIQEETMTHRRLGVYEYTYDLLPVHLVKEREAAPHPLKADLEASMEERVVVRIV